jgi:hypothetical protein
MENKQTNAPRRGRPPRSQEQITASRNVIIQAARDLFAAHGYEVYPCVKSQPKQNVCQQRSIPCSRVKDIYSIIFGKAFLDLMTTLETCYNNSPEPDRLKNLCLTQVDFWLNRPDDCRAIF